MEITVAINLSTDDYNALKRKLLQEKLECVGKEVRPQTIRGICRSAIYSYIRNHNKK